MENDLKSKNGKKCESDVDVDKTSIKKSGIKCEKSSKGRLVEKCSCGNHGHEHKDGQCSCHGHDDKGHCNSHDHGEEGHCHCHHHGEGEGCSCEHEHGGEFGALKIFTYIIGGIVLVLAFLGELEFLNKWVALCCAVAVYAFFGKDVLVGAYNDIRRKKIFTEFTLMCVASLGSACLGEFADAAAVIYLYSLGEAISGEAYSRSKRNIASLIEITEENVTVVKDKKAVSVPAREVQIGDIMSVRMGDKISLDGVVVSGEGFADMSAITGESVPAELVKGSLCLSGSSLVSGAVLIKVTEKYENSTANKLKKAVERASKQKAVREKKITRFAEIFTPIAFLVSVSVLVVGLAFGRGIGAAVRPALVVLVASCPCSLVLSVPLAYFSGIGRAALRGIVFRGGQVIDSAATVETVVFDKTGTLTSAMPEFIGVSVAKDSPISKTLLLDYSKAALLKSPHALARVFCEKYTETVTYQVDGAKNIGGRGIICVIGGEKAAFGNRKLMAEIGVDVDETDRSAIYVAVGGKHCGTLLFEAKLKDDALTQISALRGNGVKRVAIMSGDNEKTVKSVAVEVGITEYYSELKPDEKLQRLNYIYKEEKKSNAKGAVAFCGDGLNDSAAIAAADVGIAMGSGASLTVESADVVIVDDSLERLNDMIKSAKKTSRIVNQNIIVSLGVKLAVVIVGLCGYPSLELAVIADVGAAVITVLNAMRAGKA